MKPMQTTPAVVNWAGYLAITFCLLLPLSVLIVRSGGWQQGLLLYAIAALGSTLLLLLCLALLLRPRFRPWRGAIGWRTLVTLPGALLLLSLLAGRDYPAIHDITTDSSEPPAFVTALEQRGANANPLDIDPDTLTLQQAAYPDIETLRSSLSIDEAFTLALSVARQLGWDIYHQDRSAGVIEAVDITAIMAFKDDVVIRVRGDVEGTKLDLRSVSRVGVGDLGANATRIRAFREAFAKAGK